MFGFVVFGIVQLFWFVKKIGEWKFWMTVTTWGFKNKNIYFYF